MRSDSGGHRLFVTKLAADMSRSDILDYFSTFGPVADLYFPAKDPAAESAKPHKGYSFLSYYHAEDAEVVVRHAEHVIKYTSTVTQSPDCVRTVVVERAFPKKSREAHRKLEKALKSNGQINGWRVLLSSSLPLPSSTLIMEAMHQYGEIISCSPLDPHSTEITFKEKFHLTKAIEDDNLLINGVPCQISVPADHPCAFTGFQYDQVERQARWIFKETMTSLRQCRVADPSGAHWPASLCEQSFVDAYAHQLNYLVCKNYMQPNGDSFQQLSAKAAVMSMAKTMASQMDNETATSLLSRTVEGATEGNPSKDST
jgi:hypothetical protein